MQLDARLPHSLLMKHVRKKENMQQVFVSKTTKLHECYKSCPLFSTMTLAQNITHATSRVHVFRVATSQKQLFRACTCSSINCYTDPVNLPQLFIGMLDSPGHNIFWILDDVTNMDVVVGPRGNPFITLIRALATLFPRHIP